MRKREMVKVPSDHGRDAGKVFMITEWPAAIADHWGIRAIIAYNRGGGQVPMDAIQGGMETIFWLGVNTFLRGQMQAAEVIPILDELLQCVQIVRDPNAKAADGSGVVTHPLMAEDLAEIRTIWWLRSEVLRIHTNFSAFAFVSKLISEMTRAKEELSRKQKTSPLP